MNKKLTILTIISLISLGTACSDNLMVSLAGFAAFIVCMVFLAKEMLKRGIKYE